MVSVEWAEMDLSRQLNQIGPDKKPFSVRRRDVLHDGNMGKIKT